MHKVEVSELIESDRNCVFDLLQDDQAMKYLGPRRALTDDEFEQWFFHELETPSRFAFRHIATKEFVGFCGLKEIDGELDFGYLIRSKYWGKGLAKVICNMAIEKLSPTTDFSQVKAFIASDNIVSIKVAQSLGWQLKCKTYNEFEAGYLYQIRVCRSVNGRKTVLNVV
ncbi:GNAT family N-acetyltransferase [Psychromonas ossibalaenae]|uniref:GNAT family N-acetyltransferase n=1 Tax=Psychromonas ossibalaenae TaxID=444922 RepID=UPI000375CB62|nr:GNAT family N-acetyltransferase [Psychromonas ossibalaenae]